MAHPPFGMRAPQEERELEWPEEAAARSSVDAALMRACVDGTVRACRPRKRQLRQPREQAVGGGLKLAEERVDDPVHEPRLAFILVRLWQVRGDRTTSDFLLRCASTDRRTPAVSSAAPRVRALPLRCPTECIGRTSGCAFFWICSRHLKVLYACAAAPEAEYRQGPRVLSCFSLRMHTSSGKPW
jgi:hypothetical protein